MSLICTRRQSGSSSWQFLNLKQRNLSVAEYEKELNHLSKYAPELFLTEAFRCRQFEDVLNESIKRYLTAVIVLQQVNFYQLVQAAMKVEKYEESSRERFKKRRLSRGASSSSGKRARESQTESIHSYATRGRRRGNTIVPILVEVLQQDQEKLQSALIAIDDIMEIAYC